MGRFSFTGTFMKPSDKSNHEFISTVGNGHLKMNASIKAGNQVGFVEMFGGKYDTIKTWSKEQGVGTIEIPWNYRAESEYVDKVASFRTYTVSLPKTADGEKREKKFIAEYDFIQYVSDHANEIVGKKVCVTGNIRIDPYNGKTYTHYEIQNLYVLEDDNKNKERLKIDFEYYWNKDCIDDSEWESDKIITINGYTEEYIKDLREKRYVKNAVVFNASRVDEENESQKRQMDYRLNMIKTGSSSYQAARLECVLINGTVETDDFSIDDLTPAQREQVELGIKKVEDFKPKGQILGDYTKEYRLVDFSLVGNYADGVIKNIATKEEFEENIYETEYAEIDDDFTKIDDNTKDGIPFFNEDEKEEDSDDLFGGI